MFDARDGHKELRGGEVPWLQNFQRSPRPVLQSSFKCEALIVGAGITGSFMAEHLTSLGHDVCIIDREKPGLGSTAASTAMLQWEIDSSLSRLTELYGFDRAASIYRRSRAAVAGLIDLVRSTGLECRMRQRQSLYLAGGEVGSSQLIAEHELRKRAGLPGHLLDHRSLLQQFYIHREAAIWSPGSADADPLRLSQGLLSLATDRGARLFDAEAVSYNNGGGSVIVETDAGHVIEARHAILATGYVMPGFMQSDLHRIASSWAIATPPQPPGSLWRDGALIWEASNKYNYARTTFDDRIVIGGEDDDKTTEPDARDALIPEKSEVLVKKLQALWPAAAATAEFAWAGAFGTTGDGLPLIGRVPGHPRLFAAYGYGGNGITFSYLASRVIGAMLAEDDSDWFEDFAIDRNAPAA